MEYIKLSSGIVLLIAFTWVFVKNIKRKGVLHAFLRIDTLAGIVTGFYLIVTSAGSVLFFH